MRALPLVPGPAPPPVTYTQLRAAVDDAAGRLAFARFAAAAVHRDSGLSARAETFWRREREIRQEVLADQRVRAGAMKVRTGAVEKEGEEEKEKEEKDIEALRMWARETVAVVKATGLRGLSE